MKKLEVMKKLDALKVRSAWNKGVREYARDFLDGLTDTDVNELMQTKSWKELRAYLLNGAPNWNEYSWGGCALIYDEDIAERLCNPTELKRTRGGRRRPNSREQWLDTQERALRQAAWMLARAMDIEPNTWRD